MYLIKHSAKLSSLTRNLISILSEKDFFKKEIYFILSIQFYFGKLPNIIINITEKNVLGWSCLQGQPYIATPLSELHIECTQLDGTPH